MLSKNYLHHHVINAVKIFLNSAQEKKSGADI